MKNAIHNLKLYYKEICMIGTTNSVSYQNLSLVPKPKTDDKKIFGLRTWPGNKPNQNYLAVTSGKKILFRILHGW